MGSVGAKVWVTVAAVSLTMVGTALAETPVALVSRPVPVAISPDRAPVDRPLVGTPMAWPKTGPTRVVWTGFQMHGGGSRVYLQATNDVEVSVAASKEGLTVTVHDCRLHVRNGGRPMDTRFFQTPVKSVSLRQQKKDVAVLIALKEPVDVVPRKESGPNGSQFWVLDFPSGKSLLADGPRPTSAHP